MPPPRRGLPLPSIPGQTVGGGVPDAPRRLAPTPFPGLPPAETRAAANNSPCLPPRGKVAPQGRMRGRLPSPPIPRANRRRRPRRPAKPPANGHPPGQPSAEGRVFSPLRVEPLTPAHANPRAGHARPLPRNTAHSLHDLKKEAPTMRNRHLAAIPLAALLLTACASATDTAPLAPPPPPNPPLPPPRPPPPGTSPG